jgi:hypothetical protein
MTPQAANAICREGEKLLKVVERQNNHGKRLLK